MAPSSRHTRNYPDYPINILFLNEVNGGLDVVPLQNLPRKTWTDLRFSDLLDSLESELLRNFRFKIDVASIKFWQCEVDLKVGEHEQWAKDNLNADLSEVDGVTRRQRTEMLDEFLKLAEIGKKIVDLIVTGTGRVVPTRDENYDEAMDTVPDLPHTDELFQRLDSVFNGVKNMTPSKGAKYEGRSRLQGSSKTVIYDGVVVHSRNAPPDTVAPPIEIYCRIFQELKDELSDPKFEPEDIFFPHAATLMKEISILSSSESEYKQRIRPILIKLTGHYLAEMTTERDRRPDGHAGVMIDEMLWIPLLIMELKRLLGEGGDPFAQAEYSYINRWEDSELKSTRDNCNCPNLIIAGGGQRLQLFGAVITDKVIVQPLTDAIVLCETSTSTDAHIYRVARLFTAIKHAMKKLETYYTDLHAHGNLPAVDRTRPHPRFFPYPNKFECRTRGTVIEFEYEAAINKDYSRNLTFRVKTNELEPRQLIVKFSERYGYDAHQYLADQGYAPKLHYCGQLDGTSDVLKNEKSKGRILAGGLREGPLFMIVMEYLEPLDAFRMSRNSWPPNAVDLVKDTIRKLHEGGYVFGDLRQPNIVFDKTSDDNPTLCAKLIDFDWSGKKDYVFYPDNLSSSVDWPKGDEPAVSFEKILKKHDLEMAETWHKAR